jgi:hypothetical protein
VKLSAIYSLLDKVLIKTANNKLPCEKNAEIGNELIFCNTFYLPLMHFKKRSQRLTFPETCTQKRFLRYRVELSFLLRFWPATEFFYPPSLMLFYGFLQLQGKKNVSHKAILLGGGHQSTDKLHYY